MRLGVHIRIAGGLIRALDAAGDIGCEAIQLFASNPNAWKFSSTDPVEAEAFAEKCRQMNICPISLHTAYLLNLASPKDDIWANSLRSLTLSLRRADMLGAGYVVTHIGSHGGAGYDAGVKRICQAVRKALAEAPGKSMVLLESGSGSGNSIGSKFEELRDLLDGLDDVSDRVGVCLDTAHLYGSGYDISSADSANRVLTDFDEVVGLGRLRFFHLNDTQKALGSKHDRHWHIGEGNIGLEAFRAIVNHPALKDVGGVIETPGRELGEDIKNLNRLKDLRD